MQHQNHNVLDTSHIGRLLFKLTLPMFFGMFFQTTYNIVDAVFLGQFVGPLAIAGISVIFPLQMLTIGIGNMVGIGGASLISRMIGAGEKEQAECALGNGITFAVLFSIILTAVFLPTMGFWLKLIGASPEVLPFARDYLTITISGTIFNVLGSVLLTYARSEGNSRVVMVAYIMGSLLNIALDAVFIISLDMGVRGAALATVISQALAMTYILFYYLNGNSFLKIHSGNLAPDLKILKSIFAIGIASLVQALAMTVSAAILIRMAATYGGDIALSVFGIIQRVMMFSFMPGQVLGQGLQPILGYNFGARRYHLALKAISIAAIASTVFSVVAFVVLFFFPGPVMGIFTNEPALIAAGTYAAHRIFFVLPLMGFFTVGSLVFPSIGKAFESFIIAIARPLVFLMPAVLLLPRLWQLNGVWLAFPVSDTLTFLLTVVMLIPLFREFGKAAAAEKRGAAPAG
ncbi:MAG: hypothetical protein A2Z29_04185 [Chloroflexi bacterium RBG_16_56_11]|nr:MAG: hypothetical protein A2Z29_04185 [Chloroflexi bacterium RBG_16_56_11]